MQDRRRWGKWTSAGWLLACIVLLLSGCRQSPPLRGDARLSALLALHPGQVMVEDIDHRLAVLAAQRVHIAERQESMLPPVAVVQDTPLLSALPSPPPPHPPSSWQQQLHTEDQQALHRVLVGRWERQYLREARQVGDDLAGMHVDAERRLTEEAERGRTRIGERYRQPWLRASVRWALAKTQVDTAKARRISAQQYADAHAHDAAGQQLLQAASARVEEALRAAQQAEEEFTTLDRQYAAELHKVDERWLADRAAAREALDRTVNARLAALRAKHDEEIQRALSHMNAVSVPPEDAISPATPLHFPAVAGGQLSLQPTPVRAAVEMNQARSQQDRTQAVQAIDQTVTALQQQRQRQLTEMVTETRAAAQAVAAQHGYRLTFDTARRPDVTDDVQAWLQAYWPARP